MHQLPLARAQLPRAHHGLRYCGVDREVVGSFQGGPRLNARSSYRFRLVFVRARLEILSVVLLEALVACSERNLADIPRYLLVLIGLLEGLLVIISAWTTYIGHSSIIQCRFVVVMEPLACVPIVSQHVY